MTALRFPSHFPPKDRWNKFFIGVRWLGPDLSFFEDLRSIQAARSPSEMSAWGGGPRQALAGAMSRVLSEQLGWKSKVFLPEDSAAVAFHGPRFDFNDPESALESFVEVLAQSFNIVVVEPFWEQHGSSSVAELIDDLLEHVQHANA